MKNIVEIASDIGILENELELYGKYKAKLNESLFRRVDKNKNGKLILVTAINPTPAGEGKTTTTVGLGQAMKKIGKNAIIALREPSLGPVFGVKGGATGGGKSQVVPMQDINLHFTGDMHAITSANNLLCATLDNHIHQGNSLRIDARKVLVKRCLDMNDRSLRNIVVGLGGNSDGVPREDHFIITVASEVMAIFCLAKDLIDLKNRLEKIVVAYTLDDEPVYAKDLKVVDAMAVLLKDAMMPNFVQTLEGTPALIHGGPFANIAHGCNSLRATNLGLKLADYCITEAGFGADLGAEKFFDIKCRLGKLKPSAVVLVATVRALAYNGENEKLQTGIKNLGAHIDNLQKFGIPVVVAINKFESDKLSDLDFIQKYCEEKKVEVCFSDVFSKGGEGGIDLAKKVCALSQRQSELKFIYPISLSTKEKIEIICKQFYGADKINFTQKAEQSIKQIELILQEPVPICVAKTPYSFSDNPDLLGHPKNFSMTVRDVSLSNGAGFVVVMMGQVMTMPGLPKKPAAEKMSI